MIDLTKLEEILNKIPSFILSSEKKNKILEQSKILYEMNDFLCKKYNISPVEAENRLKIYLSERARISIIKEEVIDLETSIQWAVDFAKSEEFTKTEDLRDGLKEVIEILGPLTKNISK